MDGYWKVYYELNGNDTQCAVDFCKRISEEAEKTIFYLHPIKDSTGKELPHIHGLIFNWSKSDDTLRTYIKKAFNVKGTQLAVSNTFERGTKMSEEHINKYVTYMSKGKFDPIYNKAFEDSWVCERKREWKSPTTVRISGDLTIIANDVKKKDNTLYAIAKELGVWVLEQNANGANVSKNDMIDKAEALIRAGGKSPHFRQVAMVVQDAMWLWDRNYVRSKILSMI